MEIKEKVFVIMSKDRQVIAKGVPRSRYLICVNDTKDKKRILTYPSRGYAESAFKNSYFYDGYSKFGDETRKVYKADDLEAVECTMTINI